MAKLTSHTPPTAASPSTAGCCHWLAPSSAHGPPRACQERIHSISSQKLGTTASAASPRPAVTRPASSIRVLTATPVHRKPNASPASSSPGPMLGASQ
jgi:hypothetical protein